MTQRAESPPWRQLRSAIPPLNDIDLFLRQPIQFVHQRVNLLLGGLDLRLVWVLVEAKLDISQCTDKQGQETTTFRVLAVSYRLL